MAVAVAVAVALARALTLTLGLRMQRRRGSSRSRSRSRPRSRSRSRSRSRPRRSRTAGAGDGGRVRTPSLGGAHGHVHGGPGDAALGGRFSLAAAATLAGGRNPHAYDPDHPSAGFGSALPQRRDSVGCDGAARAGDVGAVWPQAAPRPADVLGAARAATTEGVGILRARWPSGPPAPPPPPPPPTPPPPPPPRAVADLVDYAAWIDANDTRRPSPPNSRQQLVMLLVNQRKLDRAAAERAVGDMCQAGLIFQGGDGRVTVSRPNLAAALRNAGAPAGPRLSPTGAITHAQSRHAGVAAAVPRHVATKPVGAKGAAAGGSAGDIAVADAAERAFLDAAVALLARAGPCAMPLTFLGQRGSLPPRPSKSPNLLKLLRRDPRIRVRCKAEGEHDVMLRSFEYRDGCGATYIPAGELHVRMSADVKAEVPNLRSAVAWSKRL